MDLAKSAGKLEFILSTTSMPKQITEFFDTCQISEVLNKEAVESPSSKIFKNRLDKAFWKKGKIFYLALGQANGQDKLLRSLLAPVFMIP